MSIYNLAKNWDGKLGKYYYKKRRHVVKVAFMTLGCKVNSYETSKMEKLFKEAGHTITAFDSLADIYIVNTCTVTNIADRKSRKMLHRARKNNPDAIVVAVGCYVDSAAKSGYKDGSVDIFVQNKDKGRIVDIVCNAAGERQKYIKNTQNISKLQCGSRQSYMYGRTRAYVKVQDGCNQYCTYCIIPYVRGELKSRRAESVVEEVRGLAEEGHKEVVITGIHVSSYGAAPGNADGFLKTGGIPLIHLLKAVSRIDGIERIRLGSLEPRIINENFVKELASIPRICPHFHLSLQSGSDTVLQRMNRHYTTEGYLGSLAILEKYFKNPAITTDIIVGFPGETGEEYRETLSFAEKAGFAQIHVFKYSRRRGTIADKMENQVPEDVKSERSSRLIELGKKLGTEYKKKTVGNFENVLFEEITEIDGKKYITGYNERYIRIAVPAEEIQNPAGMCNTISKVRITGGFTGNVLYGNL